MEKFGERGYVFDKVPYIVIPLMIISAIAALGLVFSVIVFLFAPSWNLFFLSLLLWGIVVFPYHLDVILDFIVGLFASGSPPILNTKDNRMTDKKLPTKNTPNTPDIPTFNLSGLNLLELSNELQRSLNSPSSSFVFMRERENRKLELQKDKIKIVLQTIKDLTLTQQELINFQAETFLSNEMLNAVITNNRFEIDEQLKVKKKEYLIAHKLLDDKIIKIDHDKEVREIALQTAKLNNLKTQQEINIMTANSEEAKAKAQLIMYVLKELDLKNMPQTLQTYLITSIVNPQGSQYQDFDMQEQLKNFVIKEADAKARLSLTTATQAEHQTRLVEGTTDKSLYDLKAVRDSLKRD